MANTRPSSTTRRLPRLAALLKGQAPNRRNGANAQNRHLLTGLLFDETGDRLSPVFTVKDGKRYRYYISNRLETTTERTLPAGDSRRMNWSGRSCINWTRCFGTTSGCPNGLACWCLQCRFMLPSPGQRRSAMHSRPHPLSKRSH